MNYRIKEIPIKERPRERLKEVGPENLSDKELLSIILKTGTKEKNVTELSLELLKKYPLESFNDISYQSLINIKGIGEVKALEILATIEIGKRIFLRNNKPLKRLTNAKEIWENMKYLFVNKKQEYFYALYFNTKRELIDKKLLFIGTINESIVHPREIFKEAYKLSATYIVCIHNHPTNDITPSFADLELTKRLIETGKIQGITIVDHIIIGKNNFYSFYENENIH